MSEESIIIEQETGSSKNTTDLATGLVIPEEDSSSSLNDIREERERIYNKNRGYFVVHVLEPSQKRQQYFDIFIYIIKHKSTDYSDIQKVEFFFGKYWNNKIFIGKKSGGYIGIKTSAYGPFLCTCRITFTDQTVASLYRYIDFEMGYILKEAKKASKN
jgi:hypothetical protein